MASTSPAIRHHQCSGKGNINAERHVPTDKDILTDKIFQLRLPLSAADAVAFGAADFRAAKDTEGTNIFLLQSGTVSYRLLLASDGSNNPSNRNAEARLVTPPRIRTVAIDGGGALHPHELVVTLVVERPRHPGASPNRAEQRHTLTVEKVDTRITPLHAHQLLAGAVRTATITNETSVTVTITKPRGGEKRARTPPVGAVESAAPSCKRCKQLEEQVASLEKGTAALREENAALRNIVDACIGGAHAGAHAELGAVEHIEGLLGALATTGDDDDDAGSGDDDEEQTSSFDFSNLPSLVLDDGNAGGSGDDEEEDQMPAFNPAIFGDLVLAGAGAAPDATTNGGDDPNAGENGFHTPPPMAPPSSPPGAPSRLCRSMW
jgi:hypothetical protein